MAMSEFIATRPETAFSDCALITLKPNQPMHSNQEPIASQGIEDGGMPPVVRPCSIAAETRSEPVDSGEARPSRRRRARRWSRRNP